jgi:hypothetical protein
LLIPIAGAQQAPTRPVDTDINDYVVFGFDTVAMKGSNVPGRGLIRGGDVGANGVDAQLRSVGVLAGALDATVNICANKHISMSEGSQVVGDTVRFSSDCTFWDLFANNIIGEGGGSTHSITQPTGSFPLVSEPAMPSIVCDPNNPFTVSKGDPPATILPGTYGDIEFQDNTDVTFVPGIYQMCNFHAGQNVQMTMPPGVEFRVAGRFAISNDTHFGGLGSLCSTQVYVGADGIGANDNAINFAKDTLVFGHFLTLNGKIALGNGTNLFGTFWGRNIISDFDLNVTYCPPIGGFPLEKSITGSGAGQQGEIRFDITCLPNPPNTNPIPPFIIPPGATGTVTTLVTGITLPATCHLTETESGDNSVVDLAAVPARAAQAGGAPPDVPLCPDVGAPPTAPLGSPNPQLRGAPAPAPLRQIANVFETTTTATAPTTAPTTTTTPTTTPATPAPTIPPCVLPTDLTTLPPTLPEVLPATGADGGSTGVLIAFVSAALGVVLVVMARRRANDQGSSI